ncbi:MAG: hypothetical protein M1824_005548 [Vezdaea acicularis]|nr:MAG: hypothetical protein M1824_005548 [Vezdaea acicularis]
MSTCQHVPSICYGFGCSFQGPSSRFRDTIEQAFLTPRDLTGPATNRYDDPRIPYSSEVFGNYKAIRQFNANNSSSRIEVVPGTFHTFTIIEDGDDGLDQAVERDTAGQAFLELAVNYEGVAFVTLFHGSHGLQLALGFDHSRLANAEERRSASARIVSSKQETSFKYINSPILGAARKECGHAGCEQFQEQPNREHPADRSFAFSICENNNAKLETGADGGGGLLGSKRRHLDEESSIHSGLTVKRFRPNSHRLLSPWSPVTHSNPSQLERALIRHSSLSALSIFSGDNLLTRTKDEQASLSVQFKADHHSPSPSWGLSLKSLVGSPSGLVKRNVLPEVAKSEGGSCQQRIACASKTSFGISQL